MTQNEDFYDPSRRSDPMQVIKGSGPTPVMGVWMRNKPGG